MMRNLIAKSPDGAAQVVGRLAFIICPPTAPWASVVGLQPVDVYLVHADVT